MINQPTITNYESGVWSLSTFNMKPGYANSINIAEVFNNNIYLFYCDRYYTTVYTYQPSDNTFTDIITDNNINRDNARSVVYNNKIYLFCGRYNDTYYYDCDTFDGTTFEKKVISCPFYRYGFLAIVYNNCIYIFDASNLSDSSHKCYKYDGTSWTELCTYPNEYGITGMVSYNGKIYTSARGKFYYYNIEENKFTQLSNIPVATFSRGSKGKLIVYNNEIHAYSDSNDNNKLAHYKYNSGSDTWVQVSTLPTDVYESFPLIYNGDFAIIGNTRINDDDNFFIQFKAPSKVYDPNTIILYKGDQHNGTYLTAIADTSSIIDDGNNNNRFISGFDDAVYFADTAFDWKAPMYYGDGTQWIKFKN